MLISFVANELLTTRSPILAPRLFKVSTRCLFMNLEELLTGPALRRPERLRLSLLRPSSTRLPSFQVCFPLKFFNGCDANAVHRFILPASLLPSPRQLSNWGRCTVSATYLFLPLFLCRTHDDDSPLSMLPFSLGGAAVALISGQILSRIGNVRAIMWFAWVVITLGFGLMISLDDHSNK